MGEKVKSDGTARREFLQGAGAVAVSALAGPHLVNTAITARLGMTRTTIPGLGVSDTDAIHAEIDKRHEESVERLKTWIKHPSIAAENRGMNEGCELMTQILRAAGLQEVHV